MNAKKRLRAAQKALAAHRPRSVVFLALAARRSRRFDPRPRSERGRHAWRQQEID